MPPVNKITDDLKKDEIESLPAKWRGDVRYKHVNAKFQSCCGSQVLRNWEGRETPVGGRKALGCRLLGSRASHAHRRELKATSFSHYFRSGIFLEDTWWVEALDFHGHADSAWSFLRTERSLPVKIAHPHSALKGVPCADLELCRYSASSSEIMQFVTVWLRAWDQEPFGVQIWTSKTTLCYPLPLMLLSTIR